MTSDRQQRAAHLLATSRTNLLVDGLPDASVVVDLDFNPIIWNAAYAAMAGLRPRRMAEAAANAKCHELVHLGICKQECLARRAIQARQPLRVDEITGAAVKAPDTGPMTLVVQAIPLSDERGEVYAVLEMYRNVTAEAHIQSRYKELLDAERRRAEELERMVALRTQELRDSLGELRNTQSQLIQAEKLSSLGRLVSGIAHELNNPLNFIYANLDFLDGHVAGMRDYISSMEAALKEHAEDLSTGETEYLKEDLGKVAEAIREGAERAITIVKGLRTFSHGGNAEGGPVSLATCFAAVKTLLHHELQRANVTLVSELASSLPSVFANQPQVEQVFVNLVTNALHAQAGKPGRVIFAAGLEADEVVLTVTDQGGGIPAAHIGKIFDPFYTTKGVGQGTGLGLSISRSIMLSWKGTIEVDNVAGGARFTLRFKRAQVPA